MNEADQLIEEQLKTLPPNLRQAIDSVPWKALVQEIGRANTLDAEQIASLEQETMFIIYTFEPPTDYIDSIVREVGVTEEVATNIADTVADKIFDPILQKSDELEKTKTESTPPTTASTSFPEIPPKILPMVEKGEVAHDVPHAEQRDVPPALVTPPQTTMVKPEQTNVPLPDYRYPNGQDPYREPLV